jgi:ABC-type multidrug transport system ATPase subunit
MGPSGSGKSTLLNVLARRNVAAAQIEGSILVNGTNPSLTTFRRLSSYVEQGRCTREPYHNFLRKLTQLDDALIGSLTVRETLNFAARLANLQLVFNPVTSKFRVKSNNLCSGLTRTERMRRIDGLLDSFGLRGQKDMLIGTPIRSGVSGGQKRRVSVASQLITAPKLLFLDEPTSGLDSVASLEVISYIKNVAKRNNVCICTSI